MLCISPSASKYKFIKLKQKNYFDSAYDFITKDKVQDDTSSKEYYTYEDLMNEIEDSSLS